MKKHIFSLLCVALSNMFVACETHDEPMPEKETQDFEITINNATRGSVNFDVEPSNPDMDYLCVIYQKADAEEFTRETFLVEDIFREIAAEASQMGKTFEEYMPEIVDRGRIEDVSFSGLISGTEYYIILFGVDAADGYNAITALTKVAFTTADMPQLVCDFRVSHVVEGNSVTLSVDPTDADVEWYLCTMPVAQYNYYVEDESGPQMSHAYFYEYIFRQDIDALLSQGATEEQVLETLVHKGALSLEAKGLRENTEYYFLIAGLVVDGDGIAICTDIQRGSYTTLDAVQSTMTFDIEVWDIGQMEVSFSITPSNNNDKYCALVAPWDGVTEAQDMMHNIVEQWGGWMDVMANDRGRVEHSGDSVFRLPAADTDYYIIAFGYDGGITTEACMKTFTTLPGGSVDDVQFEMKATNMSPYGFTMTVTSSDRTIYYVPGVCAADAYDEAAVIGNEEEAVDYYFAMSKEFNPSITIAEILDQYYYNGNAVLQVSGLQPDTDYLGYIYAIDVHTGKVLKTFTFPAVAHTSTFSDIAPQAELVGYYSGDDENGELFNDAAATRGRAIAVVKYTGLENVRTLFTCMLEGDYSNSVSVPDGELWAHASAYYNTCSLSSPYTFYTADWNVVHTALCYATDNNGMLSRMSRLYICPTAENKGNIEELKALVEELNSNTASRYSLPHSVVIEGAGRPSVTITPIEQ